MKSEIDENFYCSAILYEGKECCFLGDICKTSSIDNTGQLCPCIHRKYPTPEQFKEEYGEDVSDDMPVWYMWIPGSIDAKWELGIYKEVKSHWETGEYGKLRTETPFFIICACTPFGKPDDDWRPK